MEKVDVVIVGAGAAGLMCAIEAGARHRKVMVLDRANKAGKKILMSGGGRCNFTNYHITPDAYISHNPHFCKSALKRYTQWDFIELVKKHNIPFHEKMLGQLFCDQKSQAILTMLLLECQRVKAEIALNVTIDSIEKINDRLPYDTPFHWDHLSNLPLVKNEFAGGALHLVIFGLNPFYSN